MELLSVATLSTIYLIIGAIVAGLTAKITKATIWDSDGIAFVIISFILWPIVLLSLIIYGFGKIGYAIATWCLALRGTK